jgi:hypothetical protein
MADGSISLIIPTVLINAVLAHRQGRERAGASNQQNMGQPRTHCFLPCGGVRWGVPADYISREGPLNSFASRVTQGDRSCLQEMDASDDEGRLMSDDEGL